jgi:hypothetical protein
MLRHAFVAAVVALGLSASVALAGSDIYYLLGPVTGKLGTGPKKLGTATATGLGDAAGGTWSATNDTRLGFVGGAGFGHSFSDLLGLAVEANVANRGTKWKYKAAPAGWSVVQSLALTYLEFPLLARVSPWVHGGVRPLLLLGPVLGIRTAARERLSDLNVGTPPDSLAGVRISSYLNSTDLSASAKSSYVGGLIGAGIHIRTTSSSALLMEVRYQLGFGNLLKQEAGYDFKVRNLSFLLGGSFDL